MHELLARGAYSQQAFSLKRGDWTSIQNFPGQTSQLAIVLTIAAESSLMTHGNWNINFFQGLMEWRPSASPEILARCREKLPQIIL